MIKWFDKQGIEITNLSDKDIMLGIVRCDDELFVNHVLVVAKQYLYNVKKMIEVYMYVCVVSVNE